MSERPGDPNWFPEPRRRIRPQQPLSSAIVGWLFPLAAIGGVVVVLALAFGSHHGTGPKPTSHGCDGSRSASCANAPAPTPAQQTQIESTRQAFQACVRQAGGGGGFGRGGPSAKMRDAFEVCSSLLRHGRPGNVPAQPTTSNSLSPPIA